jgi:hypothetical protein
VKAGVSDFVSMVWKVRSRLEPGTEAAGPIGNRPQDIILDIILPHMFVCAIIPRCSPFLQTQVNSLFPI